MGGWAEGSESYTLVVNDPVRRARLVDASFDFLVEHGFDGLDFDWEYPANRDGIPEDYVSKKNFVSFIRRLCK